MSAFPAGSWDLSEFETFSVWADGLRKLEGSRSLNAVIKNLYSLHVRFVDVMTPVEYEDDDEDLPPPPTRAPPSSKGDTIHSRPVPKGGSSQLPESFANDPPVRNPFLAFSILAAC
jgi:hypothetical protein